MDELLTALAGLTGNDPTTVLATPGWALRDDLRNIHALAVKHCTQIDVDKVIVPPQAFQLLRKNGYDIRIAREANIVMSATLYTSAGVFVLYQNTNILHNFVNIHNPQATMKKPSWVRRWLSGITA